MVHLVVLNDREHIVVTLQDAGFVDLTQWQGVQGVLFVLEVQHPRLVLAVDELADQEQ